MRLVTWNCCRGRAEAKLPLLARAGSVMPFEKQTHAEARRTRRKKFLLISSASPRLRVIDSQPDEIYPLRPRGPAIKRVVFVIPKLLADERFHLRQRRIESARRFAEGFRDDPPPSNSQIPRRTPPETIALW